MPVEKKGPPDLGRIRQLIRYEKETGGLYWVAARPNCRPGSPAGGMANGRVRVRIDGCMYAASRIVWYLETGVWPDEIDHRDLDRANNKWGNLRNCTPGQNRLNRSVSSRNKIGIKGVFAHGSGWRVAIRLEGAVRRATFRTVEEASAAYQQWSKELHGEFGRGS